MDISKKNAIRFVLLLGLVSLLADITYEGARSITGPYLRILGASGFVVGFVAGFGELIGYGLRLVSGYIADKTQKYWTIAGLGYAINLLAIPALALAGRWEIAAVLMIMERTGKAIRAPARDVMLSHATAQTGRGWGFGIHEAMDQIGAMIGPVVVALVLYFRGEYKTCFAILFIPAILALIVLLTAKLIYPHPSSFEKHSLKIESKGLSKIFWIYLFAVALIAGGYVDFPLIAFHLKTTSKVSDVWIPIFYAIAMGVDALSALLFGRLFDRIGFSVLIISVLISSIFAPLVFLGGFLFALLGMVLWGVGMGVQESVMRACIAEMIQPDKRGAVYGIFNATYGLFWFLGSAIMGMLYDVSIPVLIGFSMGMQLVSIPFLLIVRTRLLSKS
jgi:predicted MFS family arabinose efflux permease